MRDCNGGVPTYQLRARLPGHRKPLQIRTSSSMRKRRPNTAGEARTPLTFAADQLVSKLTKQLRKNPGVANSPAAARLVSMMMAQMHNSPTGAINMSPTHNNPRMANNPAAPIAATTTHPSEYLYLGKFYCKTYSDEHFHKVTSAIILCDISLYMSHGRFVGMASGARQVWDTGRLRS